MIQTPQRADHIPAIDHAEAMWLTETENKRLLAQLHLLAIGGAHWVDGLNEAQLRARTDWTPTMLPDLWARHSAAALKARRRMPALLRALPCCPSGPDSGSTSAGSPWATYST